MSYAALSPEIEAIAKSIVDAGFQVHSALGPGLLESAYEHCLAHELETRGCPARRQVVLPIVYGSVRLDAGYRIDLLVAEAIVIEAKSVEALAPVHQA